MSTDLYADLLFNDGEGITHADLNNARAFPRARAFDQLLARLGGYLAADADPDSPGEAGADPAVTSLAYTLAGGDCALAVGSVATKVKLLPGTLFQRIAAADGAEAQFLPYTVVAGDVDITITAGHATLNRIDILQVKLEYVEAGSESRDFKDAVTGALSTTTPNKRRRVQATFSLKAGTPGATPSYPAPDAGYCVVGAVFVPATWTTGVYSDGMGAAASTAAVMRQCSVPLNVEAVTVTPEEFDYTWATNWARDTDGDARASGGAATQLVVWCPHAGQTKRIVGVDIVGLWATSGVVLLRSMLWSSLLAYFAADAVSATDLSANLSAQLVTTGGTTQSKFAHLGDIADGSLLSNPSAAAGPIGDPFWSSGGASGPAYRKIQRNAGNLSGSSWFHKAHLDIDAGDGSKIVAVTFYLAG